MTVTLSQLGVKWRFLLILYGLVTLVWMSLEDKTVIPVTVLGVLGACLLVVHLVVERWAGQALPPRIWMSLSITCGSAIGALSPVVIVLLMFFKTSWHAHPFPDYPPPLMGAMLTRVPYWAVAGLLIGLSAVIFTLLRQSHTHSDL